jgi:hypothetical protein
MLFATYPSPAGYTPPPNRNKPLFIVLGVCGGCAAIGVIVAIVATAFVGNKFKSLMQRSMSTGQFISALTNHKYDMAEAQLGPAAQSSFPVEKLKQKEESLEAKYGPFQRFSQAGVDVTNQADPNTLRELSYKLHYQKGTSTITLRFDPPGSGGSNKIAEVEWDDKSSDSGSDTGDNTGAGNKKSKHSGNDTGQ